MARIRTIKPEFPQSESMGRVSRDARLCFIMMWTIADDAGRLRGNSRMLASLLFPYDDDAPKSVDGWLSELEREGCVVRYEVDGNAYVQIEKWTQHQRIDKPSESKIPAFLETSRTVAKPREPSCEDLGPRTLTKEGTKEEALSARADPPPVQKAFDNYNIAAEDLGLAIAKTMTADRRRGIAARLKEHGLDGWNRALINLENSPFCRGKNDRNWKADLDFVIQPKSFNRLVEGTYSETEKHG